MTSQEVVDFVGARIESMSPVSICHDLFYHCLAKDTSGDGTGCDNMTAIVVSFDKHKGSKRKITEESDEPKAKRSKENETPDEAVASGSGS